MRYTYTTPVSKSLMAEPQGRLSDFLVRYTPAWITPNALTGVMMLSVLSMVWVCESITNENRSTTAFWVAALFYAGFLADWMDGRQARKLGVSSAAGEFLDHHLDGNLSLVVIYALGCVAGLFDYPVFLNVLLALTSLELGLAVYIKVYSQKNGIPRQAIGDDTDTAMVILAGLLSLSIPGVIEFWRLQPVGEIRLAWILYGLLIMFSAWRFRVRLRRVGLPGRSMLLFTLGVSTLFAALFLTEAPPAMMVILYVAFTGTYTAPMLRMVLLGRYGRTEVEPWPELVVIAGLVFVVVGALLPQVPEFIVGYLLVIVTCFTILRHVGMIISAARAMNRLEFE